jgi:hypothetical protein
LARCWRFLFWLPSTIGRIISLSLFLIQFLEICYKDELGIQFSKIINGDEQLINFGEFPINVKLILIIYLKNIFILKEITD